MSQDQLNSLARIFTFEKKLREAQKESHITASSPPKPSVSRLNLSNLTKKSVVALGGISKSNLRILSFLDHSDFAGISYFE